MLPLTTVTCSPGEAPKSDGGMGSKGPGLGGLGEQPARGWGAPAEQFKSPLQLSRGLSAQRKELQKFTTRTHGVTVIYCASPTQVPGLGQVHRPSWAPVLGLVCGPHPQRRLLWSVQESMSTPTSEEGLRGSWALGRWGVSA